MLLSSGVVWRHRDFARFRAECPRGDERAAAPRLRRASTTDIDWLERLGAPVLERETGNELTTGARFDTAGADRGAVEARRATSGFGDPLRGAARRQAASCSRPAAFAADRELLRAHVTDRGRPADAARVAGKRAATG